MSGHLRSRTVLSHVLLVLGAVSVAGAVGAGLAPVATGATPSPAPTPTAAEETPTAAEEKECEVGKPQMLPTTPAIISQLGFQEAWTVSTGQGVTVAVVDSGVSAENPHLTDAVVPGTDLVTGGDGTADEYGQGTAVAGTIAARQVEGSGLVGAAPEAVIMPVKVFVSTSEDAVKEDHAPSADRTGQGIRWAVDHGADVVVVPEPLVDGSVLLEEAVAYAQDAGVVLVAATGERSSQDEELNEGDQPRYPAAYEGVLGVTAATAQGEPSPGSLESSAITLAAPAQAVHTTYFGDGDCIIAQDSPSSAMASGYTAAAVALVAAAHPDESAQDWEYRLMVTSLRTTPETASPVTGWGLLAPYAAIENTSDGSALGPPDPRGVRPRSQTPLTLATPPVRDPGPERRRRLAVTTAVCGGGVLTLFLVAARLPNNRPARQRKE